MPQIGKKGEKPEDKKAILKKVGNPPDMEELMRQVLKRIISEKKQVNE